MSDRIAVMSEGLVEQIASPTDIYDDPATVFVAAFIGQANLWPATIAGHDGGMVTVSSLGATLPARPMGDLSGEATLMVRPERIRVAADEASAPTPSVRVRVTSLVFQGPVVRLAGEAPEGSEVVAHIGHDQQLPMLRPGDDVWVSWDAEVATALPGSPDEAPHTVTEALDE